MDSNQVRMWICQQRALAQGMLTNLATLEAMLDPPAPVPPPPPKEVDLPAGSVPGDVLQMELHNIDLTTLSSIFTGVRLQIRDKYPLLAIGWAHVDAARTPGEAVVAFFNASDRLNDRAKENQLAKLAHESAMNKCPTYRTRMTDWLNKNRR